MILKTRNHFFAQSLLGLIFRDVPARAALLSMSLLAGLVLFGLPLFGQGNSGNAANRVPLPVDWSSGHVVYTKNFTPEQAARMQHDPRLYNSWLLQGHVQDANSQSGVQGNKKQPPPPPPSSVDWSFSLGTGGVAPNMFPAKYNFDINAAPSCSNDFAVFGLNVAAVASGSPATASGTFDAASDVSSNTFITLTVNGTAYPFNASNT